MTSGKTTEDSCNSCAISQFKAWNLDPEVAELITPTCFNGLRNMAHFFVNNRFLRAAVNNFENGTFKCNGELLYLGLEDVFYITGLPVDGSPIVCGEFNQKKILEDMLGADDPKRKGAYVSKEWLRERFEKVREEDIQDENTRTIWLQRYARAYLLFLMGTILFPEKHKHTVFIGYLLFLTDLTPRVVQSFAWGAAVLAKLRDGFKQQTIKNGAVWILEMFLLERIPLLRKEYLKISEDTTSTQFPSVLHWSELMKNISANMHLTLDWESLLDQTEGDMQAAEISWRPYRRFGYEDQRIFYSHFHIFNMNIINLHEPGLSPKQLGIEKVNLAATRQNKAPKIKQISKQGAASWDFRSKYEKAIKFSNDKRYISVVQGRGADLPPPPQPRSPQRNGEQNEERERDEQPEQEDEGVMDSANQNRTSKRARYDDFNRPSVKKMKCLDLILVEKVYKFRVLLPNGLCLSLRVVDPPGNQMPVVVFAENVKEEYDRMQQSERIRRRSIDWDSPDLCFYDIFENRLKNWINFESYETNKFYTLRLHDGSKEDEVYENMWDLTPDVELLRELPQEYAFETALADLIDNSLQAIWSTNNRAKLISVDIGKDKISVFDNGPGMDASEENSIVKWGKMGSSLHRSFRGQAIGGKPPYLKPFFGMFGYGGSVSSMHLGRHTVISSKTKNSKKVCTLYLQREALLSSSGSDKSWQANGGLRNPIKDEMKLSPNGSFTKVEISELKMKSLDVDILRCKLKDIYFPYIQCDDLSTSGRTLTPIEFQVNGIDLAEVEGGEVAITNLNSSNGPHFVLQLHFTSIQDSPSQRSPESCNTSGQGASQEANAQLKCIYFPIVQGKESIAKILEQLEAERCGVAEIFESFSHVSVRCLGRLLPDARWAWLPFMEPKPRKVDKAQILKRCCSRVKCFIETDGGFYPTPSKTDLMHHHPYTTALKNFGSKTSEKERDVHVEIYKDEKKLSLQQMEKQYQEWILQMHNTYDEESDCGEDDPIIILNPSNKKQLGISSDVIRVHKVIRRKGKSWHAGQKIKVLKGACSGVYKNNIYAVLEYILLDGFHGDAGGESRIICRQICTSEEKGCLVIENENGNPTIDIRESLSLPISIIDSGKCLSVETAEWSSQLEKLQQKVPALVDILCARHCEELDVKESLPFDTPVFAGHVSPDEVVAVVRPASFNCALDSVNLDQKQIALTNFDMVLEIKLNAQDKNLQENNHIRSIRASPSSRKGFRGLYIFPVNPSLIFEKAGEYTFVFHIKDSNFKSFVKGVRVNALPQIKRWGLVSDTLCEKLSVRVGSCFPQISIACYDVYGNRTSFSCVPKVIAKVLTSQDVLFQFEQLKPHLSSQNSVLTVEKLLVESHGLDAIRPRYEARLMICSEDELFDVTIPCQVVPGSIHHLNARPKDFMKQLLPGNVVQELELEVFDVYGNHVTKNSEMLLNVDGFCFQQTTNRIQVDNRGCIDLSGLLKVSTGYGEAVSLSVLAKSKVVFSEKSQTEQRMIRVATEIPENCLAGSQLENVVFEIVNSDGIVDETIDDNEKYGMSHTLILKSDSTEIDDCVRYSFHHGCCTVRVIPLPRIEGRFSFLAAHSRYPNLNMTITVLVEKAPEIVYDSRQPQFTDEDIFFLENSSDLKTPKVENDNRSLVLVKSPDSTKDIGNIVGNLFNKQKELKDKVLEYATYIGEHEKKLETLRTQRLEFEKALSKMQASPDAIPSVESSYSPEKERILEEIELMGQTAASVVCKISKNKKTCDISKDIIGVVALLGSVETYELGRILAEFLGEELMLGVVCKSYKAVYNLETCNVDGTVNCSIGLQALASECGISLDGRYSVLCLEDTRPYDGDYNRGDPQRMLLLPNPTLPNGNYPPGFIGYAVNMIYLDANHLYTRTSGGKGLRETLFYHLFGEVQVYKTRETMRKASEKSCIQHGAVSLDGGIIRGNGVISLGRGKPSIHFPAVASQTQYHCSPNTNNMRIQSLIASRKSMLKTTIDELDKESETYEQNMQKFKKCRDKYAKFLDEQGPILRYFNGIASNSPS